MIQKRHNKTIHRAAISLIAAFCLILVGCSKSADVKYSKFEPINVSGWDRLSCVEFQLDSNVNVSAEHDVLLVVRHSNEYNYRSLCLVVEQISMQRDVVVDTIEIPLVAVDGSWLGKGSGRLYEVVDTISKNVQLDKDCMWTVGHAMRENPIVGVNDIGIVVKKRNN